MRPRTPRRAVFSTIVVLSLVSCAEPGLSPPLERTPPVTPPPVQPVPATPAFPAPTKAGEIFLSVDGPSEATGNFTSRYVLYGDDNTLMARQNIYMLLSDSVDGTYIRVAGTQRYVLVSTPTCSASCVAIYQPDS